MRQAHARAGHAQSASAVLAALLLSAAGCRSSGAMRPNQGQLATPGNAAYTGAPVDPRSPGDPGPRDVDIEINKQLENRAISPLIYGSCNPSEIQTQRWGVIRSGGNRATAYNWENNASNAGSDYLFQNDSLVGETNEPARPQLNYIDIGAGQGVPVVITVSNADYVAADKNGGGDVRNSGPNYLSTRFKANHARKNAPFAETPDANDGHVYQDEFVAFLKAKRPQATLLFSMDNEPELWSHTHAEIFRSPVTYADLWRRNHDFARATKDAWPGAEVLGFVSFGYSGFTNLQSAPDNEGRNFIEWYLAQARAAERKEGLRLIDYLDVHWYPEAEGNGERIIGTGTSAAVVAAREQAPRALWDPTYRESSWIQRTLWGPIDLLHWLQAKIDRHYPGTKLAITEWNFGASNHISGAIAAADVLGVFGKFGVGLATYWSLQQDDSFAFAAFRAYRNYDGKGSDFGDISIAATSSDPEKTTVYASVHKDHPENSVIVLINKDNAMKRAGIRIRHDIAYSKANVFVLSGTRPVLSSGTELRAVGTNAFRYEMPAQSISVVVPQR